MATQIKVTNGTEGCITTKELSKKEIVYRSYLPRCGCSSLENAIDIITTDGFFFYSWNRRGKEMEWLNRERSLEPECRGDLNEDQLRLRAIVCYNCVLDRDQYVPEKKVLVYSPPRVFALPFRGVPLL